MIHLNLQALTATFLIWWPANHRNISTTAVNILFRDSAKKYRYQCKASTCIKNNSYNDKIINFWNISCVTILQIFKHYMYIYIYMYISIRPSCIMDELMNGYACTCTSFFMNWFQQGLLNHRKCDGRPKTDSVVLFRNLV